MKSFRKFYFENLRNYNVTHQLHFYLTFMHHKSVPGSEAENGSLARWIREQLECPSIHNFMFPNRLRFGMAARIYWQKTSFL